MIRIGQINFLNCTPIFTALQEQYPDAGYSYVQGVPSFLNGLLRNGDIDVCPSSSIEYARNPEKYRLLPDLSISSCGPVQSVMLFSGRPLEELDGAELALTSESETSVILLKVLLAKYLGFRNSFVASDLPIDQALEHRPAALLIGDKALKGALAAPAGIHVYDLGELWHRFTGFPFVFALWLVREERCQDAWEDIVQLRDRLLAAKRSSLASLEIIANQCKDLAGISRNELIEYWRILSYDLSPAHLEGLKHYYRCAAECGLIPAAPDLKLVC